MFFRFTFHFWQTVWQFKALFIGLIALVVSGAFLIAHFEQLPFDHALYFSFITGLTIGYGDIVPTTPFGRLTAVLLGVVGIMFTGMVVAAAVRASQQAWKDVHGSD
ncbi:MAG: potassium channel family protein [Pseudomonadota bacterium]|nr:potassium channel family protein [Pseudomonadota bacterium]